MSKNKSKINLFLRNTKFYFTYLQKESPKSYEHKTSNVQHIILMVIKFKLKKPYFIIPFPKEKQKIKTS